jgi:hypothetical protein
MNLVPWCSIPCYSMLIHVVPPGAKASKKGHKRFRDASGAMFGDVSGPPSARSCGPTAAKWTPFCLAGLGHLGSMLAIVMSIKHCKGLNKSQRCPCLNPTDARVISYNYACSFGSSRQPPNERSNWADVEPTLSMFWTRSSNASFKFGLWKLEQKSEVAKYEEIEWFKYWNSIIRYQK